MQEFATRTGFQGCALVPFSLSPAKRAYPNKKEMKEPVGLFHPGEIK
jgi:hypothetical protein